MPHHPRCEFTIDRQRIASCRLDAGQVPAPLGSGEVLVRCRDLALTANNVTYALVGEQFGYWRCFPASDPSRGLVPGWGLAEVIASAHPGIPVGCQLFGFLPMAESVRLVLGPELGGQHEEVSPDRQEIDPVYRRYQRLDRLPGLSPEIARLMPVFWPLFLTAFLIDHQLAEKSWSGAGHLIISSASSRCGQALAWLTRRRGGAAPRIIGLTSPERVAAVRAGGVCDSVLPYAAIDTIAADAPVCYVDFSGNTEIRSRIHRNLAVTDSLMVGATDHQHWAGLTPDPTLPGATPRFFFAPTAAGTLLATLGPAAFLAGITGPWQAFLAEVSPRHRLEGIDGQRLISLWPELCAGRGFDPDRSFNVTL